MWGLALGLPFLSLPILSLYAQHLSEGLAHSSSLINSSTLDTWCHLALAASHSLNNQSSHQMPCCRDGCPHIQRERMYLPRTWSKLKKNCSYSPGLLAEIHFIFI